MTKNFEQIATTIRNNGKKLLESKKIEASIQEIGELFYTGSYALDLMSWNDIDMQVVLKTGTDPLDALGKIFTQLSRDPGFIEAQVIHFRGKYKPKMPRGVYLGLKIEEPDLGGVWKLDLWSLEKEDFEKNRALIELLKSKLTPETRALILEMKHELMAGRERVSQMASHFLYQAILLEGIKEKGALKTYLSEKGISIESC